MGRMALSAHKGDYDLERENCILISNGKNWIEQAAIDQLHDSTPQSAGALLSIFPEARQIVETEIENMLNNGTSPEDTVAKMADSINKSIEDYNLLNE